MVWNPLQLLFSKKYLGIDIGTSFIKIVEISKFGHRKRLENYGELSSEALYEKPFRTFERNSLFLSSKDISRAIRAIMEEAKIKTHQAVFSIPDFSTFYTTFDLPQMSREELEQAVRYEARQHVPLPLGEVTLDWQLIKGKPGQRETKIKILLVAVPNEIINQYRKIIQLSKLKLVALEAEVFGLIRALADEDEKRPVAIIDIGAQSTTCNIVDKKILVSSYSFDMSGNDLTKIIAKSLNVNYQEAEDLKNKYGLLSGKELDIGQILLPLVDVILGETNKNFNNFYQTGGEEIKKIILAGGTALLPGLKEYFTRNLKAETEVAYPFTDIFFPPILENTLKDMGPGYAIAVGMALRGLEHQ